MKAFRSLIAVMIVAVVSGAGAAAAAASPQAPAQPAPPPALMRIDGELKTPTGQPRTGSVLLVASVYATQLDSTALWVEQQVVTLGPAGQYTLLVGSTQDEGMPKELFLTGAARWVGIAVQGEPEQPRIMLISVPYAMKALEADSLSGKTSVDFVLSADLKSSVKSLLKTEGIQGSDPGILGTAGRIARFSGTGVADTDSAMFENSGRIGIGTTNPLAAMDIANGPIRLNSNGIAVSGFIDGLNMGTWDMFGYPLVGGTSLAMGGYRVNQWDSIRFFTSGSERARLTNAGLGIGTANPQAGIDIGNGPIRVNSNGIAVSGFIDGLNMGTWDMFGYPLVGGTQLAVGGYRANQWDGVRFYTSGSEKVRIDTSGNVGIGTTSPTDKLHVVGNVTVTGNIGAKYQDVAEWVDTPRPLEAGTLVIVDPASPNRVLRASRAYDTRVAGAVSAQPGLILGERGDTKVMVAQSGRVRVKADATYGAIRIGDLLVTSATPGHAMRSRPMKVAGQSLHRPGTLVGKALEPLANGTGEILVLLTLQ